MPNPSEEWVAFLNAIRDEPDDDAARLVFSDWLQEHDEAERAEFIRLQCQLAKGVPDPEERHLLQARMLKLRSKHGEEWLGRLRTRIQSYHFDRGMIGVTIEAERFGRAAKLYSPGLVQKVRLTGGVEQIAQALRSKSLAQFHTLDLSGLGLRDGDVEYLFMVRGARHGIKWPTHRLDLRNNFLDESIPLLLASPRLANLEHIELDGNPMSSLSRTLLQRSKWGAHYMPTPTDQKPATLLNSIGMRFVRIPAGTFIMGSPPSESHHETDESQHTITLTNDFYMSTTLVTQWQFQQVMGRNPSRFTEENRGGCSHPVENITWVDAITFCEQLSSLSEESEAKRICRMPWEAEWEYACRAGTKTAFAFGDNLTPMQANYHDHIGRTTPVGNFPPNDWGIYDMHGNVREWCMDWYDRSYYRDSPSHNPTGPENGQNRVLRGGSFDVVAVHYCRSAYRVYFSPLGQLAGIGFRVVFPAT